VTAKTLECTQIVGYMLVMIAVLGSGVSCSKEAPEPDKKPKKQNAQSKVSPRQEEEVSHVTLGKTDNQEKLVSTGKEVKVEPNDVEINRPAQILFWRSGAKRQLNANEAWVAKLRRDCEVVFISSDDLLKEAVTQWTLEKVRTGEALELLYQKQQHFNVRVGTKSMYIDGLLIPLKPLHGNTVVIYHRLGSYSAGPLINTEGKKITDQLRQVLVEHDFLAE